MEIVNLKIPTYKLPNCDDRKKISIDDYIPNLERPLSNLGTELKRYFSGFMEMYDCRTRIETPFSNFIRQKKCNSEACRDLEKESNLLRYWKNWMIEKHLRGSKVELADHVFELDVGKAKYFVILLEQERNRSYDLLSVVVDQERGVVHFEFQNYNGELCDHVTKTRHLIMKTKARDLAKKLLRDFGTCGCEYLLNREKWDFSSKEGYDIGIKGTLVKLEERVNGKTKHD